MRVLIVGAGAVGQVYGYHLQQAGVEVGFLMRPKYVDAAVEGFRLFPLNRPDRGSPRWFRGFGIVTSPEEAAQHHWDQVMLAVSTPAIMGDWLTELLAALPDTVTVVSLQAGPEGRARMRKLLPPDRVVHGLIAFIAYQAPLRGEHRFDGDGIAYWFPPGPSPFAGPPAPVAQLVDSLKRGGCPAGAIALPDLAAQGSFASALLQVHVATLEAAGWGWTETRAGDHLALARDAWREAAHIAAQELGQPSPWWTRLVTPLAARLVMSVAPWVVPIDLETYLAYHFTKVGQQTRDLLDHWIRVGHDEGLPTPALTRLRGRIGSL